VRNEHVRSIEVADDQNTARDPRRLEFVEVSYMARTPPCVVCCASADQELCHRLPCRGHSRKDCRDGYWMEVLG
jgi:hypothetical protein